MTRHRLPLAPHEETSCASIHHCPGDADTGSPAQGAAAIVGAGRSGERDTGVGLMRILGLPSLRGGTQYLLVAGFVNQAKLLWSLEIPDSPAYIIIFSQK